MVCIYLPSSISVLKHSSSKSVQLLAFSNSSIQVGSPKPWPGCCVERVGVMDGNGVRDGKGLGVGVFVRVGKGVRVGCGVLVTSAVGVLVGCVGVAVKDSAISAIAVLRSNVGGKAVEDL